MSTFRLVATFWKRRWILHSSLHTEVTNLNSQNIHSTFDQRNLQMHAITDFTDCLAHSSKLPKMWLLRVASPIVYKTTIGSMIIGAFCIQRMSNWEQSLSITILAIFIWLRSTDIAAEELGLLFAYLWKQEIFDQHNVIFFSPFTSHLLLSVCFVKSEKFHKI